MTWRDRLRPASFRGVRFQVDASGGEGGRRAQVHEYPQRDEPFVEDLGRKARRFKITAYVIGPEYTAARDALIRACEEAGAGTLVHPTMGELRVACDGMSWSESKAEGGVCRFELSFVEAGRNGFPSQDVATQAQVRRDADVAVGATQGDFGRRYRVAGQPDFVAADVVDILGELADTIAGARGLVGAGPSLPLDAALGALADGRLPFSAGLAGAVTTALQTFRATSTMAAAFGGLRAFGGFGRGWSPLPATTAARRQQQANRDALAYLVRRNAAIEQARLASYVEFADPDLARAYEAGYGPVPDWTSATGSARDPLPPYNTAAPALIIGAQQDALAFRDRLRDELDAVIVEAGDAGDDESYDALVRLRAAAMTDIATRAARLAAVAPYALPRGVPSLVLAHRLYQDANRDGDLVRRNRVAHPAFMPAAGEALAR